MAYDSVAQRLVGVPDWSDGAADIPVEAAVDLVLRAVPAAANSYLRRRPISSPPLGRRALAAARTANH